MLGLLGLLYVNFQDLRMSILLVLLSTKLWKLSECLYGIIYVTTYILIGCYKDCNKPLTQSLLSVLLISISNVIHVEVVDEEVCDINTVGTSLVRIVERMFIFKS